MLENDDVSFDAADVLFIHERTGVPLVFDHQHFCCLNPAGLDLTDVLGRFLKTWPSGVRPKLHFSSPRTEQREMLRRNPATKRREKVLLPPKWTAHADYCDPFAFIALMRRMPGNVACDVMLEAKAKDLALRRLRSDLARYAPDIAGRFGIAPAEDRAPDPEGELLTEEAGLAGTGG